MYKVINFTNSSELEEWALQAYGNDGWELAQVVVFGGMGYPSGVIIFKRQELVQK